jgi:hypothetical protein
MAWDRSGQRIACDADVFEHEGPIQTDPTHDCAHLLVAAASALPWRPVGPVEQIKLAEYNASVVEHLLDEVYTAGAIRAIRPSLILQRAVGYAEWFVTTHYAPFPVNIAEARRQLVAGLDAAALVRLSPHFFTLKRAEHQSSRAVRASHVALTFDSADAPIGDSVVVELQKLLAEQLHLFILGTG